MLQQAISKIKDEISKNASNSYVQVVGGFLLQHLEANPGSAEKIIVADKTISKSLDEMRKAAEKKKVGNCAVLTDQEGFDIILKYFGIESTATTAPVATNQAPPVPKTAAEPKPETDFDVKLEDLL